MASLVLTAVGTALGGPIGGALGALAGRQIDNAVLGQSGREGPRLKELDVSTSSYGAPIPRLFGKMRCAGTIIWSTDLIENSESAGGGKGQPSTTSYSYSVSLAVALSSRPIIRLGRIWADGNLLRGMSGDLKVGGTMRLYRGYGDQNADPLIAGDKGLHAPAFRNLAYAVFENLDLTEFGNRIPALTFEVIADEGEVALGDLLGNLTVGVSSERDLPGLAGYSDQGGTASQNLALLGELFPFSAGIRGHNLTVESADRIETTVDLPIDSAVAQGDDYAFQSGRAIYRGPDAKDIPTALRYYDLDRDFQAGLQRAEGRARIGREITVEFPGSMTASDAKVLINSMARRSNHSSDRIAWRTAELDPQLSPGAIVTVPGRAGHWRIDSSEWRDQGVELELIRIPSTAPARPIADPGQALPKQDLLIGPTNLATFELPWDGQGSGNERRVFAAVSSPSNGWKGAALYADNAGELELLSHSAATRATMGQTASVLPASDCHLFEREAVLEVSLVAEDLELPSTDLDGLANGANRALLGDEVIQFAQAIRTGASQWQIKGLLRGRGGTEAAARTFKPSGQTFVLLDDRIQVLPLRETVSEDVSIIALGLGDPGPVRAEIALDGCTLRPLVPVHGTAARNLDGSLLLSWTRRARGAWNWNGEVSVPLGEASERYLVGVGEVERPSLFWETSAPQLVIDAAQVASLRQIRAGQPVWVRQIGDHTMSDPLLLCTLS